MDIKNKRGDVSIFDNYLGQDETILWMGRPNPLSLLSSSDLMMIPFSLMWGGFAIFWESLALSGKSHDLFFTLWGIPFVVIGQYIIWGRFVHKYLRRKRTYYAVTNQRTLVLTTLFGTNLKTYFLHQVLSLQRQGRSVLFEVNDLSLTRRRRQADWLGEMRPGFYALADADEVYGLIQNIIMQPKAKNY